MPKWSGDRAPFYSFNGDNCFSFSCELSIKIHTLLWGFIDGLHFIVSTETLKISLTLISCENSMKPNIFMPKWSGDRATFYSFQLFFIFLWNSNQNPYIIVELSAPSSFSKLVSVGFFFHFVFYLRKPFGVLVIL